LGKAVALVAYKGDSLPFSPYPGAALSGLYGPAVVFCPFLSLYFTCLYYPFVSACLSAKVFRLWIQVLTLMMGCVFIIKARDIHDYKAGCYIKRMSLILVLSIALTVPFFQWKMALGRGGSLAVWETGTIPKTPVECERRVAPNQLSLFVEDNYAAQFSRVRRTEESFISSKRVEDDEIGIPSKWTSYPENQVLNETRFIYEEYEEFNETRFVAVRNNRSLCSLGFQANEDLNGLGVRLGIYFQWLAALLSNHLLPASCDTIQTAYLFFNFSLAIATFAISLAPCTFSVEVEVLYWLYWGGVLCVFSSNPNQARLGTTEVWVGLNVRTTFLYATHVLMLYHGIWFERYAYDQVFSRMPCGTYHFVMAPVLDPSPAFSRLRDTIIITMDPAIAYMVFVPPWTVIMLAPEMIQSIRTSAIYQLVFGKVHNMRSRGIPIEMPDQPLPQGAYQKWRDSGILTRIFLLGRWLYQALRRLSELPDEVQCGIRLITPLEIEVQWYSLLFDAGFARS
jgi:hypothetical protein